MGLSSSLEDVQHVDIGGATNDLPNNAESRGEPSSPASSDSENPRTYSIIKQYLLDRVPEFRKLDALRQQVKLYYGQASKSPGY